MPIAARLQDPITLTGAATQAAARAMDVRRFRTIVVQLRKLGGGTGTVTLEHAPEPDEDAFETCLSWTLASVPTGGASSQVYAAPLPYIRWKATSPSSSPVIQIDVTAREDAVVAGRVMRLQGLTTLTEDTSQAPEFALDLLAYRSVAIQTRVLVGAGVEALLYLQHAPVLDENAFEDVTYGGFTDFSLNDAGNTTRRLTNLHRFLRWRGDRDTGGTDPRFLVDVVARGV